MKLAKYWLKIEMEFTLKLSCGWKGSFLWYTSVRKETLWVRNWVSRGFSWSCSAFLAKPADFSKVSPRLWMTDECNKPCVSLSKGHPCSFTCSTPRWAPRCGMKAVWAAGSSQPGVCRWVLKSLGHSSSGATSTNQHSSSPFDPHLLLPPFDFSSCLRFTATLSKYITGNKG